MRMMKYWKQAALGAVVAIAGLLPVAASADSVVTYDMSDFSNMSDRTEEDVKEKYLEALKAGDYYINGDKTSYYTTMASTTSPYAAGVLSEDTLESMEAMSNFMRWLIGEEPLTANSVSNASLQAQALDRNFEFNHYISSSSKPDDMDEDLWNEGYSCTHNILAKYYTPSGAVIGWMNEGYNLSSSTWGTVGHRTAILSATYSSITYGFSGTVAIGKCGSTGNTFTNAFAAFPSGYFPANLISQSSAAWDCRLNTSKVKVTDASSVVVTVTDVTTGESYECTSENGYASVSTSYIAFRQPREDNNYYDDYEDNYEVTITGLTDVATSGAAAVTYTVNFFSVGTQLASSYLTLERNLYAYTGSAVEPAVTVKYYGTTLTEGTDYEVSYLNNTEIGTGLVIVTGKGKYFGVAKKTFTIREDKKILDECTVTVASCTYTGSALTPAVTVTNYGDTLVEGTDYTLEYSDNVEPETGKVLLTGIGNYSGSQTKEFTISKLNQTITVTRDVSVVKVGGTGTISATAVGDISYESLDEDILTVDADGTVHGIAAGSTSIRVMASETDHYKFADKYIGYSVKVDDYTMTSCTITVASATYTGSELTPTVTVKYFEDTLTEGTDYTVAYSDNINPGTGTATITGMGDYSGSASKTFTINRASQTMTVSRDLTTVEVGGTAKITATAQGTITYSSSDTSILTVDEDGTVHAVAAGTGYIYVMAAASDYYYGKTITLYFKASADIHTMVDTAVTYADGSDNTATVTRKCSVCGTEETTSFTTLTNFTVYWWEENSGSFAYYTAQVEGTEMHVSFRTLAPSDAENTDLVVTSSDESVATVNGLYWTFVGTGMVTITVSAKYNPSVQRTATFTVDHALGSEGTVITKATCVKKLQTSYVCTQCGETVIVDGDVDADNHTGKTYLANASEATCTEDGYTGDTCCSDCNAVITGGSVITATGHDPVTDAAVAASCTTAGLTEGSHCSVCNAVLTAQETVKALGHSYTNKVTTAATCTTAGVRTYTCKRCSYSYTKKIAATGHTAVTDPAVAATCTTTGLTEGSHCSVCNTTLTAQETVAALGHSYTDKITKAATCTAAGVRTFTCSNCGDTYTESIAATGHTAVTDPAVAATCTTTGLTEGSHCSVCNAVLTAQKTVAALGHTVVTDPAVAATCTTTGLTEGSHCSVCNAILTEQETVKALGHSYTSKITTDATCTTTGVRTYTCKRCSYTYTKKIAVMDHTAVTDPAVAASCTTTGLTEGSHCSVCNAVLTAQETVAALGHTVVTDPAVAATYTATGLTEGSHCSVCGEILVPQETVAKLTLTKIAVATATNTTSGVTITWNKVAEAEGYRIYRKIGSGSYTLYTKITSADTTTYTDTAVTSGTTYSYAVRAYVGSVYGAYTGKTIKYLAPASVSKLVNYSAGIQVQWAQVTGAGGYYIYRKADTATSWSRVGTVTSGSTLKWSDTNTTSGMKYKYCVKAYSGSYMGAYQGTMITYRVTTPTISSVTNSAAGKATVTWNKNTSATGYQISYTTGSTTKTITVSGNTNVSKVISGLTKGKTYTVKVRSYRKVGTTYYYSTWSSAKSVKITK